MPGGNPREREFFRDDTRPKADEKKPSVRRKINQKLRRKKVLELRLQGHNQSVIALKLGVQQSTVSEDLRTVLNEFEQYVVVDNLYYCSIQLTQINEAIIALRPKVMGGDNAAINSLIKCLDHQAKILGLYKPQKVEVQTTPKPVDQQIEELKTLFKLEPISPFADIKPVEKNKDPEVIVDPS
jgi:predicted XRE-type DNA-binding protein